MAVYEPTILDLSCNICDYKLNQHNICNTECGHHFCTTCFFKLIRNTNKCVICDTNFMSINHEKIKSDLYDSFPAYVSQWSTFIRLKNLNDGLTKINKELNKELISLQNKIILVRENLDYNSGFYFASIKAYKLTKKGNYYVTNYPNSNWVRGYKDGFFKINKNNKNNKPNENVKYEEPHCDGCSCFENWNDIESGSDSSGDIETDINLNNNSLLQGYMQYC